MHDDEGREEMARLLMFWIIVAMIGAAFLAATLGPSQNPLYS
jgi:hypothetical protein